MKNSRNLFLFSALLVAGLAMSARAQNDVYAVEFNTGNNGFGTINLMNGTFTEIADLGGALYNDIAYAPDGTLFGIANNGSSLVTFDKTDGTVTTVASLERARSGIHRFQSEQRRVVRRGPERTLYH